MLKIKNIINRHKPILFGVACVSIAVLVVTLFARKQLSKLMTHKSDSHVKRKDYEDVDSQRRSCLRSVHRCKHSLPSSKLPVDTQYSSDGGLHISKDYDAIQSADAGNLCDQRDDIVNNYADKRVIKSSRARSHVDTQYSSDGGLHISKDYDAIQSADAGNLCDQRDDIVNNYADKRVIKSSRARSHARYYVYCDARCTYPNPDYPRSKFENTKAFVRLSRQLECLAISKESDGRFSFANKDLYEHVSTIQNAAIWTYAKDADIAIASACYRMKKRDLPGYLKRECDYVLVLPIESLKKIYLTLVIPVIFDGKRKTLPTCWVNISRYVVGTERAITIIAKCNLFKTCSFLRLITKVYDVRNKVCNAIKNKIKTILSYRSSPRDIYGATLSFVQYFQGDIYRGNFGHNRVGSEIYKSRPMLIVSSNKFNATLFYEVVIAIPLTRQSRSFKNDKIVIKPCDVTIVDGSYYNGNSYANISQIIVLQKCSPEAMKAQFISQVINQQLMKQIITRMKHKFVTMMSSRRAFTGL